mmetsp:Transcript_20778/g.37841  ORF Transcript_20778/g.37841 Transcript_20778/m.37841 type:complete len:349 (+) Transcript_20778:52-1098(+)
MGADAKGLAAKVPRLAPHFMIVSSMKFAQDIVAKREALHGLGYRVSVPNDTDLMLANPDLHNDLEADLKHCREQDELRRGFELVAAADAVLVLNHPKNGVDGYIGTSVLMELAISHYLKKHIFLLYPTPSFHDHRWAHEVAMMRTCCLQGDTSLIPLGLSVMKDNEQFEYNFEGTEEKFRELHSWSWQVLGHEVPKFEANCTQEMTSTVHDLPNRERDRQRVLSRGLAERPGSSPVALWCPKLGVILASSYNRLLFGDHGPYVELLYHQIQWEHFVLHTLKGPHRHAHFHWTKGREVCIYEQYNGVHDEPNPPPGEWSCSNNRPEGYAEYCPGRMYLPADLVEPARGQ